MFKRLRIELGMVQHFPLPSFLLDMRLTEDQHAKFRIELKGIKSDVQNGLVPRIVVKRRM